MTAPAFRVAWTDEAITALGTRCTVPQAGSILAGLSPTQSYEAAKRGELGVPVLSIGRRLVVPTSHIRAALGLAPTGSGHRERAAEQQQRGTVGQPGTGAPGAVVRQLRSGGGHAT